MANCLSENLPGNSSPGFGRGLFPCPLSGQLVPVLAIRAPTRDVASGLNKQIAADLGTVEKTIKVHRARIMTKMAVRSLADLVRVAEQLGVAAYGATTTS